MFAHLKLLLSEKNEIEKKKENHTLIFRKIFDHRSSRQYICAVIYLSQQPSLSHQYPSNVQRVKASCEPELQNRTSTNAFNFKVQLFSTNFLANLLNLQACVCCCFPSATKKQGWLEKVLKKSYTTNQGLKRGDFRDNTSFLILTNFSIR